MIEFLIRRVLWIAPVLFVVAAITFYLMHRAPGGPWDNDKPLAPATEAALNARFGLNKPAWINPGAVAAAREAGESNPLALAQAFFDSQFFTYIANAVRGDLGPTYESKGAVDVQTVIKEKFPFSLKVGLVAALFAVLLGVPLGVLGALKQNTWIDYLSLFIATIGVAVPNFVIGIVLIIFMSSVLGIPPLRRPEEWQGFGTVYLVPGCVLGLGTMAYVTRLTRSSMLEIKRQDYIRTARAKGLADLAVIARHMLRNSLIPVVTILGPALADLVTGSFIIESIFNVPGMGSEFVSSINGRDYSVIMGTTLFYALLVALANLSVDLSYGVLDPRIRARRS